GHERDAPSFPTRRSSDLGIADEGLAIYLDQETLDDGSHMPPTDDVATLLGLALQTFDIQQYIDPTTPITSSAGYNVYLTTIQYADRKSTRLNSSHVKISY